MSVRPRQLGSTEDLHLPDGRTLTITVAAIRSHRPEPEPVAAGYDSQSRGAWWDEPAPTGVPHTVRVAERDDRFGGWQTRVRSAEEAEHAVRAARTALLAGWRPDAGDPPGL